MKIFTELSAVQGGSLTYSGYPTEGITEIRKAAIDTLLRNFADHNLESATNIVDFVLAAHDSSLRKCETYIGGVLIFNDCINKINIIGDTIAHMATNNIAGAIGRILMKNKL